MNAALPARAWTGLGAVLVGVAVSWWVYVPAHELLHAFGCWVTGGRVERLEISPEYGAALLAKVFPFVTVGSDYAGRLSGFDTYGNDLTYLATVFAPYLLTIFIGVPLLRAVVRAGRPSMRACFLFGVAAPVAFAPLVNVIGDYYELGSIAVSRLAAVLISDPDPMRWRSDDLFLTAKMLFVDQTPRFGDMLGTLAGFAVGVAGAFLTYFAGRVVAERFARRGAR